MMQIKKKNKNEQFVISLKEEGKKNVNIRLVVVL